MFNENRAGMVLCSERCDVHKIWEMSDRDLFAGRLADNE